MGVTVLNQHIKWLSTKFVKVLLIAFDPLILKENMLSPKVKNIFTSEQPRHLNMDKKKNKKQPYEKCLFSIVLFF